jgi:hypothetical protein
LNPCAAVEPLRDDADAAREAFTPEQIGKPMQAAEGDWKGANLAGYTDGLRLRDIAEMEWSAVDVREGCASHQNAKDGRRDCAFTS